MKRQIISLDGGFKVIADLNAYHAFVHSLKQPPLVPYFEALKMLGNVYIIEDPKELAQLVRDASIFRGTLTPDDVYEFLQVSQQYKHPCHVGRAYLIGLLSSSFFAGAM